MDVTPLIPKDKKIITGYGNGGFKINQEYMAGSLLVAAETTISWDAAITLESLAPLLSIQPAIELLLLGTGKTIIQPDAGLRNALRARGITIEAMDTGAACRTYNILMSEERRVGAALIAV